MQELIRTIVVGIAEIRDGDPHLAPAVKLSEAIGSVLHVVHAFHLPDPVLAPPDFTEAVELHFREGRQEELQTLLEAHLGKPLNSDAIVCHAVPGPAAEAIVLIAEREGAGLVIVGGSRRGPVASSVLGTTAQRVLRGSPAPVLMIRGADHDPPRRILLTTDLSEFSATVHERGMALAATLWDSPRAEMRSLLVAGDDLPLPSPLKRTVMQERAEARLASFLQQTPGGGAIVEGKVRLGLSAMEIVAEAEEWGADLLILGTTGRTGFSRFMIGSVAETVLRKAPCNVLLIPAAATDSFHPPRA